MPSFRSFAVWTVFVLAPLLFMACKTSVDSAKAEKVNAQGTQVDSVNAENVTADINVKDLLAGDKYLIFKAAGSIACPSISSCECLAVPKTSGMINQLISGISQVLVGQGGEKAFNLFRIGKDRLTAVCTGNNFGKRWLGDEGRASFRFFLRGVNGGGPAPIEMFPVDGAANVDELAKILGAVTE